MKPTLPTPCVELGIHLFALFGGQCLVLGDVVARGVTPGLRVGVDQDEVLHGDSFGKYR